LPRLPGADGRRGAGDLPLCEPLRVRGVTACARCAREQGDRAIRPVPVRRGLVRQHDGLENYQDMDLGLKGRRALVTAASKGIGRACAEALIAESSSVFIASRDPKAIQAAAEKIGAAGFSARDLSHPGDPEALVSEAIDRLGGLDLLVVNTGGPPPGLFESISLAGWDEAYQIVLMSAVRLVKAAVPHLRHSDAGRIVFITSVSVRQPIQRLVLSSSMRAAVTGLAKTLSE